MKRIYFWSVSASLFCAAGIFCLLHFLSADTKKHDFTGRCQLCHSEIPASGTPFEEVRLTDTPERLCSHCHDINMKTSHPVGVVPRVNIPLQKYLDDQGEMTCLTCHEVHKEERASVSRHELEGLLRGHTQGRAFCFLCHNENILGANWRHSMVVNYAHQPGKLSQRSDGAILDEYSVECLSCHDGVISKMTDVKVVKSGSFQHGIGLSHPVGVEYPRGFNNEFAPADHLPTEVKLFSGSVGCLTCHNPYAGRKSLLVMENDRSVLCLTCHKK